MTDRDSSSPDAGPGLPAPLFFDPSFERIPAAAGRDAAGEGPVLLLYDPDAHREWVADAAVALATEWARSGTRTVLADLGLDEPLLHERIGMSNQDGVVDIFLYGASLARSARPVPGRGFYLISAGTYTSEPATVLRHPRWDKIVTGFRDAQAALFLFAPAGAEGVDALAHWARSAILLGPPGSGARLAEALGGRVAAGAWLAPPGTEGQPVPALPTSYAQPRPIAPEDRFPEPEPAPEPGWDATVVRSPAPHVEEEFRTADETVGAPTDTLPVPDPAWEKEKQPAVPVRRRDRKVSPALVVLLVLVLLAAGAYFLLAQRPDLLRSLTGGAAAEPETAAPVPAVPTAPAAATAAAAGTPLPYAVSVTSYTELDQAAREKERLQSRFPEAQFYVVPEPVQGVVYYHVLAGLIGDTAQAAALRERLIEEDAVDPAVASSERWALVQTRPLAYSFGEYATDSAAWGRVDSLAAVGVPAYVVPVPYTDGAERWRVYGGAFRDSASARPMGRILDENRIRAPLVTRTGRPPAEPK